MRIVMSMRILASIALATAFCFADSCDCEPVCETSCFGEIEIGGNWLYMSSTTTPIEIGRVIQNESVDPFTIYSVDRKCFPSRYQSGYEIFARYRPSPNCSPVWDVKGTVLSHDLKQDETIVIHDPKYLVPLQGFLFSPTADRFYRGYGEKKLDLFTCSLEIGGIILNGGCLNFRSFGGAVYADLKQRLDFSYTSPVEVNVEQNQQTEIQTTQFAKFSGTGPFLGFEAAWNWLSCVSLFGSCNGQLFVSKTKGDFSQASFIAGNGSSGPNVQFRATENFCSEWRIIPSFVAQIGLFAEVLSFSCLNFSIQGGFRAQVFIDALPYLQMTQNTSVSSYDQNTTWTSNINYSLSGWFLGGTIVF